MCNGWQVKDAPIIILGLTFKEDCPDLRNSRVIGVIRELQSYGARVIVHEPVADVDEALHEYGVELTAWKICQWRRPWSALLLTRNSRIGHCQTILVNCRKGGVMTDVKSMFDENQLLAQRVTVWREFRLRTTQSATSVTAVALAGDRLRWFYRIASDQDFAQLNQSVVGLDNFSTGHRRNLDEVKSLVSPAQWGQFQFVEADIRDADACRQACQHCLVLHQAWHWDLFLALWPTQ